MNIDVIMDLVKLGHQIVYFKEDDLYYVISSFTPIDHDAHIFTNQLTGRDITKAIHNLSSSFKDSFTINTTIDNIQEISIRFSPGIKWLWFSV